MKSIIIIFCLLFSNLISIAQKQPLSAGDELIKAKKNFVTGTVITIVGGGLAIAVSTSVEDMEAGGLVLGGLAGIAGIVCYVSGAVHIGNAGKILNEKKIGLSLSQDGIGMKINLSSVLRKGKPKKPFSSFEMSAQK